MKLLDELAEANKTNLELEKRLVEARTAEAKARQNLQACAAVLKVPRLISLYQKAEQEKLSQS